MKHKHMKLSRYLILLDEMKGLLTAHYYKWLAVEVKVDVLVLNLLLCIYVKNKGLVTLKKKQNGI